MISRIWHGYTGKENADAYENLLRTEIFQHIRNKNIPGFVDIQLLRSGLETEVEFITIMRFKDLDAVKQFAGENYQQAVVPEHAQKLLKRYDHVSQHYEVVEELRSMDI